MIKVRRESEVWKVVNKERRRVKSVEESIKIKE